MTDARRPAAAAGGLEAQERMLANALDDAAALRELAARYSAVLSGMRAAIAQTAEFAPPAAAATLVEAMALSLRTGARLTQDTQFLTSEVRDLVQQSRAAIQAAIVRRDQQVGEDALGPPRDGVGESARRGARRRRITTSDPDAADADADASDASDDAGDGASSTQDAATTPWWTVPTISQTDAYATWTRRAQNAVKETLSGSDATYHLEVVCLNAKQPVQVFDRETGERRRADAAAAAGTGSATATTSNDGNDDDELEIVAEERNYKCPLTSQWLESPVRSTACGHVYSQTAVQEYIASYQARRAETGAGPPLPVCPVAMCRHYVGARDLVEDHLLARQVKEAMHRRRLQELEDE